MKYCKNIYCKILVEPEDHSCPNCGYPQDLSKLDDPDFIIKNLPEIEVKKLIDMHQILPKAKGNFELQLRIIKHLNIEKILLQSVPSKVTSLYNNQELREVKAKYGDPFYISQFSDPRIPFVSRKLKRYARDKNKVIKLLPCVGFQPDAPKYDRFWGAMEALGLVAMVHTGFITARHKAEEKKAGFFLNSKYGRPIFFDKIARKFPDLQIILCHMGGGEWYKEACQMVTQHDNVWGDISGPGIWALKGILKDEIAIDWHKVFWGNDSAACAYPFNLRLQYSLLENSACKRVIPYVFYKNGARFFSKFLSDERE